LLAYLLYYLFSSLGGGAGRTSAGITLFFIYIMYISTPELKAYIIKIPIVGNGVNALISLSLIVAIILVFWGLIGLFRGQGMGGGAPTPYTPAPPRVGGGGFRPRGTGLFSRMNPWSRYSKNKKATEAEDARLRQRETLTRQVRQIVASMGARYAIMQGNAGGANLNLVFRYLHALPGTPPPLGINAALINANRTVLMNTYTAYMNEWNALYNAIGEIYRLDAALRAQVITQLGRPI